MSVRVAVRDGAVYLPAAVAETYFRGIDAVVLLIRDGALQVLPVHGAAAGGCLLKIRNAAGDRVAAAPDLFQAEGLAAWAARDLVARWSSEACALIVELPIE